MSLETAPITEQPATEAAEEEKDNPISAVVQDIMQLQVDEKLASTAGKVVGTLIRLNGDLVFWQTTAFFLFVVLMAGYMHVTSRSK